MTGGGFDVDPESLALAANGINDVIGQLNDMGILGEGEAGRGFGSMELTGLEAGDDGVQSAFADFCDRWGWGVRGLVADANNLAEGLGLSAGVYYDVDQYMKGAFKDLAASTFADPHLSDQQIESQSYAQLMKDAITPDYSASSFDEAGKEMKQTWTAVGKDAAHSLEERYTDPAAYYEGEAKKIGGD